MEEVKIYWAIQQRIGSDYYVKSITEENGDIRPLFGHETEAELFQSKSEAMKKLRTFNGGVFWYKAVPIDPENPDDYDHFKTKIQ